MHPMKLEDLDHIVRDEDAFILYLQSYATSLTDLVSVSLDTTC
jgi:hypothetical protein